MVCGRLLDRGICKYGCTLEQPVCHWYLKFKKCKYGNNCRNLHLTKGAGKGMGKEGPSHIATDTQIAQDRNMLGIEDPTKMDEASITNNQRASEETNLPAITKTRSRSRQRDTLASLPTSLTCLIQ